MTKKPLENSINKKLIIQASIILIVIILLGLFMFYIFGVKIQLILEQEMQISLNPSEKSYNIKNDEIPQINFTIKLSNPSFCTPLCNYTLRDLNSNNIVGYATTNNSYSSSFNYFLPMNTTGHGQKMYSYTVACYNQESKLCSTNKRVFYKTALVSVNHKLSSREQELEYQIKNELELISKEIFNITINLDVAKNLLINIRNTSTFEEEDYIKLFEDLNNSLKLLIIEKQLVYELWVDEQFEELYGSRIPTIKLHIDEIENKLFDLLIELNKLLINYNNDVTFLSSLDESEFEQMFNFYDSTNFILEYKRVLNYIEDVDIQIINFLKGNFSSFDSMHSKTLTLAKEYEEIKEIYLHKNEFIRFNGVNELLKLENSMNFMDNLDFINYSKNITLKNICEEIPKTKTSIDIFNIEANITITGRYPFLKNNSLFEDAKQEYKEYVLTSLENQDIIFKLNNSLYGNISLNGVYEYNGKNITKFNLSNLSEEEFAVITDLNLDSLLIYKNSNCKTTNSSFTVEFDNKTDLKKFGIHTPVYKNSSVFLPPTKPTCCIYDECLPCCKEDECKDNYPVIFVHGHALRQHNSPEDSLHSFSLIQSLLENEGYINAGQITGDSSLYDIPKNEWGKMDAPISVRVSYYYLTYVDVGRHEIVSQKTDKIENYAIRLKDLIDVVKYRTGKDKVNIVAHSMGGLVSREYISLFGEENVEKLILIGTPNNGTEGSVSRYCSVMGSSRECDDMKQGSIFLKRLNANQLTDVDVYTIRADNCDMDIGMGDGVILERNVPLAYAKNYKVNGTCTPALETTLHTNLVNPYVTPQTYDLIREILLN